MEYPTGTVTFLFTDVEGSTRLLHELGERYSAALDAHSKIIASRVSAADGLVVNTEGDAFFCVFSNAVDAVTAAVGIQRDLFDYVWPTSGVFRVRMGIHTGEGTLGARDYVGVDVHRAARISGAGHGGQILVSAETYALVGRKLSRSVSMRDLGEHWLKDLPQAEHLFQIMISGLENDFPALKSESGRQHNLPATLNTFVGRSQELLTISERLSDSRLITLVGPGGTGKTRLAIEVGTKELDRFPDGVWIAQFAAVSDSEGVQHSLAAALRLRERPGTVLVDTISDHLAEKSVLIILDNCEHLLAACAEFADRLLVACPDVRILATSRQALRVPGEVVHQVPGLTVPSVGMSNEDFMASEAVQLFVDRAKQRKGDFSLTVETSASVVQICRRLDGIPLAIELAAARVNVLGVGQIADRLDDRFRLLTTGNAADLPHHRTLRLAMDWSYDLLGADEASLFRRLSVFAGGCSLEAVESVCSTDATPESAVLDLLQSLIEKSLVVIDDHQGTARYRLLETVRVYAGEKLAGSGEKEAASHNHGSYYLHLVEEAEPALQGSGDSSSQAEVLDRLELDHGNFRAAMEGLLHTEPDVVGRLAAALWRYWEVRGYLNEGSEWLKRALEAGEDLAPEVRAKALAGAGKLAWRRGAFEEAEPLFRESLHLWRIVRDRAGEANALHGLARAALNLGDHEEAQSWGKQSLTIQTELKSQQGIATAINTLGEVARFKGDLQQALDRYTESLDIYEEIGDTAAFITVKHNLGYTALGQGDIERAEARFFEAMTIARDLQDHLGIFSMFGGLAAVAVTQGDAERAATLFGAADAVATDGYAGDRVDQIEVQHNLAATKAALEPAAFNRAWRTGEEMERGAAISYALEPR
ncbi:MAG: tetratricopeptide repeat protein [Acidimicrobiia bacterium]